MSFSPLDGFLNFQGGFYSQRRRGSVELRHELEPGLGGYTIRPYTETESGFVGAACMAARAAPPVGCTFAERTVRNRVRLSQGRWSMHPVPAACGHAALRPKRSSKCLAPGWQTDARCAPLRQRNHRAPPRVGTRSGRPCRPPLQGNRGRVLVSAFSTAGKPSRCRSPPPRPHWGRTAGLFGRDRRPRSGWERRPRSPGTGASCPGGCS